jgi:hypothetical protein
MFTRFDGWLSKFNAHLYFNLSPVPVGSVSDLGWLLFDAVHFERNGITIICETVH